MEMIHQLKWFAETKNIDLFVSTSRRTAKYIERLVENEFIDYPQCKMLVIANKQNKENAVSDILSISSVVLVTCESVTMISEAASSGKPVLVVKTGKERSQYSI